MLARARMTVPLISICVPAFKAEKHLGETLESIRGQTFADWEVIVTEDGSKDGAEAIVQAFGRSMVQKVTYHRHDPNRGLPATRNHGISNAHGTWIALLDSDDLWTADHLETLAARAAQNDADLIHAGSLLFESDTGKELETRAPSKEEISAFPLSLFLGRYVIQPSSVLLRKQLWQTVGGFNPDFRYVEDREMWLRCARAGGRFAYTGKITCRYRKHGAALSRHSEPMAIASAKVCEQYADWERLPRALRRREIAEAWTAAGRLVLRQNPKAATGYFRRALRYGSFTPRIWAYLSAAAAMSVIKPSSPSS